MPRKMPSNGNGPTSHNAPVAKTAEKKEWDVYLALSPEDGEKNGKLIGAFNIKGGISPKTNEPYICLSGFSKEYGKGMSIFLNKKVDKLIDALVAAGYLEG